MIPEDIIRAAKMDGVTLALSTTDTIKVSGDSGALNRWLVIIRARKAELVRVLSAGEQAAPAPEDNPAPEVAPFLDRRDRLCRAGLNQDEAGLMAWKLERRDFEGDERRLCIECQHLTGSAGRWSCFQWRMLQIVSPDIPGDLVTSVLHRCGGFEA